MLRDVAEVVELACCGAVRDLDELEDSGAEEWRHISAGAMFGRLSQEHSHHWPTCPFCAEVCSGRSEGVAG